MRKSEKNNIYIAIIIVLMLIIIAMIFAFSFRTYTQYSAWRSHHNYFKNSSVEIESWMTVKMISTRFNLTTNEIFQIADINKTGINQHATLDLLCRQYNQNCTEITEKLNNFVRK